MEQTISKASATSGVAVASPDGCLSPTQHAAVQVRRATRSELPEVVATLAGAFFDDPINRWILPDDAERAERAPALWSAFTNACWVHRTVYVTGRLSAAALWVPPGRPLVSAGAEEEFVGAILDGVGSADAAERIAALMATMDEHHPVEDHWYLPFIGVDPSDQGQGLGSALLCHVLGQADRLGVPAYLEASCPRNRCLYERHGFRTTRELTAAGCPPMYAMWRDPRF